ncbi:MAG: adenine phosphoribosyltransferase [Bifidobacterium sp.]|nr:adenine phosphoribosyltransferase [Bifidobacterium sp.]
MTTQQDIALEQPGLIDADDAEYLISRIRSVRDFPKDGILFRDFMPVLADARALSILMDALVASLPVAPDEIDAVAGLEARGFLFGPALAARMGKAFIAVRKAGKLPPPVKAQSYSLEYGSATMEVEEDAIHDGERVLIVDDLIATGGSAAAARDLVIACGGRVAGFSFVMELVGLGGAAALGDYPTRSLLTMPA